MNLRKRALIEAIAEAERDLKRAETGRDIISFCTPPDQIIASSGIFLGSWNALAHREVISCANRLEALRLELATGQPCG